MLGLYISIEMRHSDRSIHVDLTALTKNLAIRRKRVWHTQARMHCLPLGHKNKRNSHLFEELSIWLCKHDTAWSSFFLFFLTSPSMRHEGDLTIFISSCSLGATTACQLGLPMWNTKGRAFQNRTSQSQLVSFFFWFCYEHSFHSVPKACPPPKKKVLKRPHFYSWLPCGLCKLNWLLVVFSRIQSWLVANALVFLGTGIYI